MFDQTIGDRCNDFIRNLLLEFSEIRSVAVNIDWRGALNDAKIVHNIWRDRKGDVVDPAAILGSAYQSLRLLNAQLGRYYAVCKYHEMQLATVLKEYRDKQEELAKLKAEIHASRPTNEGPP